jgi:hypothetical protein
MKRFITLVFCAFVFFTKGQNTIEWDGIYQLRLSDFQSPATQIGGVTIYSLHSAASFDFAFAMSNGEFMFTKNFNPKVNCTFRRDAASLVAPDSIFANDLLGFARYEFDLAELYARKFRKRLYEEKDAFSDVSFFQPIYDSVHMEFAQRHTIAGKVTDLGRNREKLHELQQEVLNEIQDLSDFCKLCKPTKKKRK